LSDKQSSGRNISGFIPIFGITCVIFLVALIIAAVSLNLPITEVFAQFFNSTITTQHGVLAVLRRTTYILIVSLGLGIAFRSGIFNAGGEGQILVGGLAALTVGLFLDIPPLLFALTAFLVSFFAAGGWGLIPGVLKAKWNVSELLATLMLNFVALAIMNEIAGGPLRDYDLLIAVTRPIPNQYRFPFIAHPVNVTILISLAFIVIIYLLMERSVIGYQMRLVGTSKNAAAYAGIQTGRLTMLCLFLSGGVVGLSGTMAVVGQFFRAEAGITGMYGFYSILSALLAKNKPHLMLFTSLALAFIITGMQSLRVLGMPGSFNDAVIGLLFIIAGLPEILSTLRRMS
jgi:simple sugar transport system permease protein